MEKMVEERTEQFLTKNYELECINIQLENANRAKTEFLANVTARRNSLTGRFSWKQLPSTERSIPGNYLGLYSRVSACLTEN